MSPTHANKRGVRYRYYVSHVLLQKRKAGAVARVPAPELEALVLEGVRQKMASSQGEPQIADRELIERYAERVITKTRGVDAPQ
jgi:site-specific DNA recombinase